ncbi:MAG TPA: hypothetical protein PKW49_12500 [Paludibacteraceae bacterium]|nr:hypothetical protein [Paludibacteraceae bacterium]HQF51088.1 hypothetical protein [Paludibacteraceae bacterium]HQJ89434.1 hypothetical protein [Paludibacteraceae bacterium]
MKNKVSLLAVIVIALEFFLPLQAQNKKGLQTPYVWMCTSPVDNKIYDNPQYVPLKICINPA